MRRALKLWCIWIGCALLVDSLRGKSREHEQQIRANRLETQSLYMDGDDDDVDDNDDVDGT